MGYFDQLGGYGTGSTGGSGAGSGNSSLFGGGGGASSLISPGLNQQGLALLAAMQNATPNNYAPQMPKPMGAANNVTAGTFPSSTGQNSQNSNFMTDMLKLLQNQGTGRTNTGSTGYGGLYGNTGAGSGYGYGGSGSNTAF